jgi:hypothetical protein
MILIIIFSILTIVLIAALFIKKEYTINRTQLIKKPIAEVFNYLRHIKNQDDFSKWVMTDPAMQKKYTGTDGTVGFIYGWDSKNKQAGAGEQEIIQIDENKKIDIEVRFERPMKSIAKTPFMVEKINAFETKVIWEMHGKMNYPINFLLVVMNMDKLLGNDMQTSLHNLKSILEK